MGRIFSMGAISTGIKSADGDLQGGLRCGELSIMRRLDSNFDGGTITLAYNIVRAGHNVLYLSTRRRGTETMAVFFARLINDKNNRDRLPKDLKGKRVSPEMLIGREMSRETIDKYFKAFEPEFSRIGFYDLRYDLKGGNRTTECFEEFIGGWCDRLKTPPVIVIENFEALHFCKANGKAAFADNNALRLYLGCFAVDYDLPVVALLDD